MKIKVKSAKRGAEHEAYIGRTLDLIGHSKVAGRPEVYVALPKNGTLQELVNVPVADAEIVRNGN